MKEYTNSQIALLIDEHIHSARDREILKLHFIDGLSCEQIAGKENIDLSARWVYTIISRNMAKLARFL